MSDRKKPGVAFWATVGLVAVLVATCGYGGAYLYMLRPMLAVNPPKRLVGRYPDYSPRLGRDREFWDKLFAPAHSIDQRIRPDFWSNHPY